MISKIDRSIVELVWAGKKRSDCSFYKLRFLFQMGRTESWPEILTAMISGDENSGSPESPERLLDRKSCVIFALQSDKRASQFAGDNKCVHLSD